MPASTIHDLLPIPQGTKQPHAYHVFGLPVGEQDPAAIKSAVSATVKNLKASQAETDPKLWNQAARLVQQGKQILANPEMKSALDARFGIISTATRTPSPVPASPPGQSSPGQSSPGQSSLGGSAADPLASMLPSADPLAPAVPVTPPLPPAAAPTPPNFGDQRAPADQTATAPQTATAHMPGGLFGTSAAPVAAHQPAARSPVVVVADTKSTTTRRRRRSVLGVLSFVVFSVTMFGLIAGLGYFLLLSDRQISIRRTNQSLTISAEPPSSQPPVQINQRPAPQPQPLPRRPPVRDDVMGTLAGDMPPPQRDRSSSGSEMTPGVDPAGSSGGMSDGPDMADNPAGGTTGSMASDDQSEDPDDRPAKPIEMTEELIAAAEQQLTQVADLIRAANWKEMKSAAESLLDRPLDEGQKQRAIALYEVADLATYYRGGIERGVETLNVGNDFEVTDAFRVIVVETGEDLLVVRYNAKNMSYTFDEFPFSLAHRLASFAMPDEPTTVAAKAVYQTLAPRATEGYRDEALEWLESIAGEVEGADPKRVAETLQSLLADNH